MSAQYRFDSWTTDNGLPQNGVRSITQTPDGYLWFTTFDGLVRFDGLKFTVFDKNNSKGIINNRFWVLQAFGDGSIWAGTEGGDLTIYRRGILTSYSAETVPDEQVLDFITDTNAGVLIATNKGFYKLQNDKFVFVKSNQDVENTKKIYKGKSGTRWEISSSEILQIKLDKTRVYSLSVENLGVYYANAFEDKAGGLWFGDLNKLIYLKDGSITEYGAKDGYPQNTYAHRFWEETDGSLWFATGIFSLPGVGLVRFKDGKFTRFGVENGLSNDRIFDAFKDREGTIWVATDKGLNRLRRQVITSLSTAEGLVHNEVYPMLKARDGSVYVGTVGGLSRYDDGKFSNIILRFNNKQSPTSDVQSLWEDESGHLWVGVVGGLFVIENGNPRDLSEVFGYETTVLAIHSDRNGNIWFGTDRNGVFQYRDGRIIANYTTKKGLAGNDVKVIHEAGDGSLWFGTYGGLSVEECRLPNSECHLKSYTTADGLASNSVRSIKEDADGTMWIGTYDGGLSRFKDGKFFTFNTDNGLFNNGVFATVEDEKGNFWISSNRGIFRVNKESLNDFADGKIKNYESFAYGRQDGMLSTECNGGRQPSALKDSDGKIWFPTLEGVAVVDPNNLQNNPLPPPVEIESVTIDRENVAFGKNSTIELAPTQNYLDISYTALSFIKSDQIRFRYKLEGLDKGWVDAGTRRTVNFAYLPPGEYVFKVTAANSDGIWNTEGKSFKIVVLAPVYKTWRFWLAVLITLGILGFIFYHYRINHFKNKNLAQEAFSRQLIESQESERKRIAQELHDGLGQNLLVIKNRAMLGLMVEGKDEQFSEIQESVTDALSEVRTIAYNLRPLHIERLGLSSTIEEMIEEVEAASQIGINCDIEKIDDLFSPEDEINIYRIVQESLNNIVKHSNAKRASVEIYQENQKLFITIKDDGSGFDVENIESKKSLGLNGIAERAKILNGIFSIDSKIAQGTKVSLEIGLKSVF